MKHRFPLLVGVVLTIVLAMTPLATFAQEPLTQKFVSSSGSMTYSYPAGWETQEEAGMSIVTNSLAALEEDTPPPGVVAVLIVEPGAIGSLVFGLEDISLAGVVTALAQQMGTTEDVGTPQAITLGGRAAARLALSVDLDVLIFAIESGADLPIVAVALAATGELAPFEPTVQAIVASAEYTPAWKTALYGHADWVNAVAFSPDGAHIASGSDDYTVRLWDAGTGEEVLSIEQPGYVQAVAFAPDGAQLASANSDGSVELWDAASGAEVLRIEAHVGYVQAVTFSPDGAQIASGGDDYLVQLWDAATGASVATFEGHEGVVNSIAYSPDGTRLASASDDYTVRLWNVSTGEQVLSLEHPDYVNAVAFSPDGRVLATGSDDGVVRLWDATTGALLVELIGHTDYVKGVAFSPDGNYLVSGSDDSTVRLWELGSGWSPETVASSASEIAVLGGHSDWVNAVAFSPDGKTVASASDDGSVLLWDAVR